MIYIQKKEIFLFDGFEFEGFKEFILQDDRKTLNKILYGIKRFERKDNKVTIITLNFSMNEYEKIKNANRLSTTTQDVYYDIILSLNWSTKLYNAASTIDLSIYILL